MNVIQLFRLCNKGEQPEGYKGNERWYDFSDATAQQTDNASLPQLLPA